MVEISSELLESRIHQAAAWISEADALLIGAGAGMGVDSGLPDFRGNEGFWKAYPPFKGRMFAEMSNPAWFQRDPNLAWGFFGHRMNLYRDAIPHVGYHLLKKWLNRMPSGGFVYTSNVDGQFLKAGFDPSRIVECHGSISRLQCTVPCSDLTWPTGDTRLEVDMQNIRATSELPQCTQCGRLSRPNILMFGDFKWVSKVTDQQTARLHQWIDATRGAVIVAVECGAGLAIPSVRHACERIAQRLIRINPRDDQAPDHGLGIPLGAADALQRIEAIL